MDLKLRKLIWGQGAWARPEGVNHYIYNSSGKGCCWQIIFNFLSISNPSQQFHCLEETDEVWKKARDSNGATLSFGLLRSSIAVNQSLIT